MAEVRHIMAIPLLKNTDTASSLRSITRDRVISLFLLNINGVESEVLSQYCSANKRSAYCVRLALKMNEGYGDMYN